MGEGMVERLDGRMGKMSGEMMGKLRGWVK